jgi:ornithine cyclodeaminase
MSGTLPAQDVFGFKAFHLIPGAGVRYLVALYRLSDGEPLALIDANHITVARTSAAAAAAASRYFGSEPVALGVIGTGTLARDGLRALASVCSISRARVFSRSAENRESYAEQLGGELGLDIAAAPSPGAATAEADMVLCATQTDGTVALHADDAGPARYISSVSSTLPAQRELDGRVIATAGTVVVDTPDALRESGDLIAAREAGLDDERVVLLASYVSQGAAGRDGRVVYKSIGSVEQDLSLAAAVWREAQRRGAGEPVEAIEAPR